MNDERWTPRRKNLLMYFESRLVDDEGRFDHRHMNREEMEWANDLDERGLIEFSWATGYVGFSEEAWKLAHKFRKERSERMVRRRMEE